MKYTLLLVLSLIWSITINAQQNGDPIPLLPLLDNVEIGLRYGEDNTIYRTMNVAISAEAEKGIYALIVPYLGEDASIETNIYADFYGRTVNVISSMSVCDELFQYGYGHGDGNATTSPLVSEFVVGDDIFETLMSQNISYDAPYAEAIQAYIASGYNFHFMLIEKTLEDYPFEVYIIDLTIRYTLLDEDRLTMPLALQAFHQSDLYNTRVVVSGDSEKTARMSIEGYPIVNHDIENATSWKTHPFNHTGLGSPSVSGWSFIAEMVQEHVGEAVVRYAGMDMSNIDYLTTFDTLLMPEQSKDWTFIPTPDLPDFAEVDVTDYNPIYLHQCTSETAQTPYPEIAEYLPAGHTFIELPLSQTATAIHPIDWQVSPIDILDIEIPNEGYVIAPTAVTKDDLIAFMNGEDAPPMLLVMQQRNYILIDPQFRELINIIPADRIAKSTYPSIDPYLMPAHYLDEYADGLLAFLLVSDEHYNENSKLYDAMLQHYATYRYWLHPQLEHTAYLKFFAENYNMAMLFSYPEGMYPDIAVEPDGTITIYDDQDDAQVIIETIQVEIESPIESLYGDNLDDDGSAYLEEQGIEKLCQLEPSQLVPIVKDGENAYLTVSSDVHIIYKADGATISDELLEAIALSTSRNKFYRCP